MSELVPGALVTAPLTTATQISGMNEKTLSLTILSPQEPSGKTLAFNSASSEIPHEEIQPCQLDIQRFTNHLRLF